MSVFFRPIVATELNVFRGDFPKGECSVKGRPFTSIAFRIAGNAEITTESGSYFTSENSIVVMPEGMPYHYRYLEDNSIFAFHFKSSVPIKEIEVTKLPDANAIMKIYNDAFIADVRPYFGKYRHFYDLLMYVAQKKQQGHGEKKLDARITSAAQYLHDQFKNHNLNIHELATYAGMSEGYFRKRFFEVYQETPVAYIKRLRMKEAKTLLASGYYTVREVAERAGFGDATYFCTEFKKTFLITPLAYKNANNG